jgi:hypothetical protein
MDQKSNEKRRQLPGVISTISAGFDLTTHHLWLIVLPFVLDVFYWIGPRLSIRSLVEETAAILLEDPVFSELIDPLGMVEVAEQTNLFTSLSIPLIGIPALMNGAMPSQTPLSPLVMEVENVLPWFIWLTCLTVTGLVLTSIYLNLVGLPLQNEVASAKQFVMRFSIHIAKSAIRLFALGIIFIVILFLVWLPLLPVAVILGSINMGLSAAVMLFGVVAVALYLSLAVPGIILGDRPVIKSVKDSFRMVHRNMMPTMNLMLTLILIGTGTNLLWRLADDGSWLTLVSLAGHAFINTALIATFFIFYRDRSEILLTESI